MLLLLVWQVRDRNEKVDIVYKHGIRMWILMLWIHRNFHICTTLYNSNAPLIHSHVLTPTFPAQSASESLAKSSHHSVCVCVCVCVCAQHNLNISRHHFQTHITSYSSHAAITVVNANFWLPLTSFSLVLTLSIALHVEESTAASLLFLATPCPT